MIVNKSKYSAIVRDPHYILLCGVERERERERERMAMAKMKLIIFYLQILLLINSLSATDTRQQRQSNYIVHVSSSHKPPSFTSHRRWYNHLLGSLSRRQGGAEQARILYSYSRISRGFSASLTVTQAAVLRGHPAVISVVPDRLRHLHTTHTPSFLHLSDSAGLWPAATYAADVIVGVIDTGIYPLDRRSFFDAGLPPPPSTWRGACESSNDFNASLYCNNKLIGARSFYRGYEATMGRPIDESTESKSPLDTEGHGSHTASTAAGNSVNPAGFYNYANGEARGMACNARIAAYKVCWAPGCYDSDILAAFDAAVSDGVNVISLSVGASYAPQYYRDSIAIASFNAVKHGVLVSCSAGNSGPGAGTATNIAPWILTVGASTVDREFPADVILGDGTVYNGVSLYAGEPLQDTSYPLVYGGDCGSKYCYSGDLNSSLVARKIVLCDRGGNARVEKGNAVKLAGGAGMIMANSDEFGDELLADSHLIPATMVGASAGNKIRDYIKSANPTAHLEFRGTVIGKSTAKSAPRVAAFSSRGPSSRSPQILKPDVIAPGVNILAAWTGRSSPTDLEIDSRRVEFNIISGTSMSCPHVSGLCALLRKAQPNWSPTAVKSALMTTAVNLDNAGEVIKDLGTGEASTPFVRGAGHVDPNGALNPGLVYDASVDDYLAFLCSLGYTDQQMAVFTNGGSSINCTEKGLRYPGQLNYPSFAVVFDQDTNSVTYTRLVKNVGKADSVYEVTITSPPGTDVTVSPTKLTFDQLDQIQSYSITFKSTCSNLAVDGISSHSFGSISWTDGEHVVQSPIAVTWTGKESVMVLSV